MSPNSLDADSSKKSCGQEGLDPMLSFEVLDLKHVAQLNNMKVAGGRTLFSELIAIYSKEAPSRFNKMREAFAGKDAGVLAKVAHAFVGSSASIGARQMQAVMRSLEQASLASDWNRIQECFASIEPAWTRLQETLAESEVEDSK